MGSRRASHVAELFHLEIPWFVLIASYASAHFFCVSPFFATIE